MGFYNLVTLSEVVTENKHRQCLEEEHKENSQTKSL